MSVEATSAPETWFSIWRGRVRWRPPIPRMADLICDVADEYEADVADLRRGGRASRQITRARWDFMRRAHATGRFSSVQIGRFLNMDHTSVLHGLGRLARKAHRG